MATIHNLVFGLIVVLAVDSCHGYGWGVPETACGEMFPSGHKFNMTMDGSPFSIEVNATEYQPGQVIEIQILSDTVNKQPDQRPWFYEGAFLQVRTYNCTDQTPKGTFEVDADEDFMQPIKCADMDRSAIRHYSHAHIYTRKFYWRAPDTPVGHVVVRGVIARNKAKFWNVYSATIKDASDNSPTEGLPKCGVRTIYDPMEFCPADMVGAAIATTSGSATLFLAAIFSFFLYV